MSTDTDIIIALARKLEAENTRLRAENEALRAGQGRWPEKSGEVLIDNTDYVPWESLPKYAENHVKALREAERELKDLHMAMVEVKPASESTAPRVISAEEVEVGQLLAVWGHDEPTGHPIHTIGVVSQIHDGSVLFEGGGMWFELIEDAKDDDCTIVLLEDAPTSDTPPAPRLTVHALNTAPVGSVVISGTLVFTKNHDGDWISNDPALGYVPHEIAAITPDANATLTYPERGDHE